MTSFTAPAPRPLTLGGAALGLMEPVIAAPDDLMHYARCLIKFAHVAERTGRATMAERYRARAEYLRRVAQRD